MKIIYAIIIMISFGTFLNAQENLTGQDTLIKFPQNSVGIQSDFNINNSASIQQLGSFNQAQISQSNNSGILPNTVEINQVGYSNTAASNQSGNGNLTFIGQYGADNSADINEVGNLNIAGVMQYGNGNTVQQDLIGDGMHLLILQNGNDNFINQFQTEPTSVPLQIHQQGNGMRLTIINGGIR